MIFFSFFVGCGFFIFDTRTATFVHTFHQFSSNFKQYLMYLSFFNHLSNAVILDNQTFVIRFKFFLI